MNSLFVDFSIDSAEIDPSNGQRIIDGIEQWSCCGEANLVIESSYIVGHHSKPRLSNCSSVFAPRYFSSSFEWCLFDGRIDNRALIKKRLGIPLDEQADDLELFYRFYKTQGIHNLHEIIGPFAFIIFCTKQKTLIAGRDCMGGRYLAFCQHNRRIVVSNSLLTLLVHPELSFDLNIKKIVSHLGFIVPEDSDTLMQNAYVVKPGHVIQVQDGQLTESLFYLPNPKQRINDASKDEVDQEFKRLLTQSIRRRIDGFDQIGAMLSGGLDSVPMTIIAAQAMQNPTNCHALTWVFDQYPESDERQYIKGMPEQYGFTHHIMPCDRDWPSIKNDIKCSPVLPIIDPYIAFHMKLDQQCQSLGLNVVLSGVGGDSLFSAHYNILIELLVQGRLREVVREGRYRLNAEESCWAFIKAYIIKQLPGVQNILQKVKLPQHAEWLTKQAHQIIGNDQSNWLTPIANLARRPRQYHNLIGMLEGNAAHLSRLIDGNSGYEKRFPYRDRELVEFMLAIPSSNLHFDGMSRPIVRTAFRNILPEAVLNRTNKTDFYPTIEQYMNESEEIDELLMKNNDLIDSMMEPAYLTKNSQKTPYFAILRWYSGYYQHWVEKCYNKINKNRV